MKDFSEFDLIAPLQRALTEEGYERPTPIQAKTLPPAIEGRDVLGIAQTGTGKTAAFALPILNWLGGEKRKSEPQRPCALILAPTRELAIQIGESFATYGRHLRLRTCTIFGGVGQAKQVRQLNRGVHVLVATPGRLLDLMNQGHIYLDMLEIFVLDEADRMLDMGFLPSLKKILKALPDERQSLFFSATLPPSIKSLANQLLEEPVSVRIAPQSVSVDRIEQRFFWIEKREKQRLLRRILRGADVKSTIVFTKTKRGANRLAESLVKTGTQALAIHGNKSQSARQKALAAFREKRVSVLVATDVAARGIDIQGITHVINYDLPHEPESYVHRIGRTGRAGADGIAISFCQPDQQKELRAIEKLIGKRVQVANALQAPEPTEQGPRQKSRSKPQRQRPPRRPAKKAARGAGGSADTEGTRRRKRKSAQTATVADAIQPLPNRKKGTHHRKKQQHISEEKTRDGQESQGSGKARKTRRKKKTSKRISSKS